MQDCELTLLTLSGYFFSTGNVGDANAINCWVANTGAIGMQMGSAAFRTSGTGITNGQQIIAVVMRSANLGYAGWLAQGSSGANYSSATSSLAGVTLNGGATFVGARADLDSTRFNTGGIDFIAKVDGYQVLTSELVDIAQGTPLLSIKGVVDNITELVQFYNSDATTITGSIGGNVFTKVGTAFGSQQGGIFNVIPVLETLLGGGSGGGGGAVKGVRVTWRDRAGTLYPSRTGLRIRWYDEPDQFNWGTAVVNINNGTSASGTALIEVNLAGSALSIGQTGSLVIYDEDSGNNNNSLVFHGRMSIIDIQ